MFMAFAYFKYIYSIDIGFICFNKTAYLLCYGRIIRMSYQKIQCETVIISAGRIMRWFARVIVCLGVAFCCSGLRVILGARLRLQTQGPLEVPTDSLSLPVMCCHRPPCCLLTAP